jgi:osmotically inducible lipoprotein OsmB
MKNTNKLLRYCLVILLISNLTGCSGMSNRDKNTAIGAGVGAAAGAVITGGSAIGTVGGAVVGGAIGNQVEKDKK